MKKVCVFFVLLLSGCSWMVPKEHPAPQIMMKEQHYIFDTSDEAIKELYEVSDEEGVSFEVSTDFNDEGLLCVSAVNEYEKSSQVCKQYETYEFEYDYDYQNTSLDQILNTYLSDHQIQDQVYYFYHNTVTEEEYTYRENEIFLAASTVKVAMCMAWTDLIEDGVLSYDSTLYYDPSLYEISYPDLTEFYPLKSQVPLSVVLENAIVYSDNSCANMMFVYYKNYADETFRQWLAHLSPTAVPDDFNYTNKATVGLMLNTMKKLYREQDKYQKIIENMKIASEGEYIKQNEYSFEVAQKYGLFEEYQHAMGLMETHQPILVGVFTTLYPDGNEVIADMSKIMAEYAIAND